MDEQKTPTPNSAEESGQAPWQPKHRRRRFGDRKDGRRVRGIHPMRFVLPFLTKSRADAQNHFEEDIDVTNLEAYLDAKHAEGYTDMGFLHVFMAAYVRTIARRPAINRFLAGQHIFARPDVVVVMPVKKKMSLVAPDTLVKVHFDQRDTAVQVFEKFDSVYRAAIASESKFDRFMVLLKRIPRLFLRMFIAFLQFLDYFGLMPRWVINISPFHGSVMITSMGSLGINAIYHHLYNFGNLPVFLSYGRRHAKTVVNEDGVSEKRYFITLRAVLDERICDGYYYASGFKIMKRMLETPELLDTEMTQYTEDID